MSYNHLEFDFLYWFFFALGQGLFLLKRADLARRSPLNGVPTIGAFFYTNWVTILYRSVFEVGLVFYPYRHFDINSLIDKLGWNLPIQVPQSLLVAFFLGVLSDYLMDWIVMQDKIGPIKIPGFLKENIPQLPEVKQLVDQMAVAKADAVAQAKQGVNEEANKDK